LLASLPVRQATHPFVILSTFLVSILKVARPVSSLHLKF
jgi:hypothetical protein